MTADFSAGVVVLGQNYLEANMKKYLAPIFFLIVLALFAALQKSPNIVENIKGKGLIKNNEKFSDYQKKLLEAHNKERVTRGYENLHLNKKLCEYAEKHANYMVEKDSLVHSRMSDLAKVNNTSSVGENIAWGQEDEISVVNSWMWSPMHRWNILGSSYKQVGFGMKEDKNGRKYWCTVFSN